MKHIFENFKKDLIAVVAIIIATLSIFGGCSYLNHKLGLQDDNLIEESIEKIIEEKTDISIDLTPESEEL